MKIFSLKSKTSLVLWAVVLGLFVNAVLFILSMRSYSCSSAAFDNLPNSNELAICTTVGRPFSLDVNIYTNTQNYVFYFFVNLIFWILVVFMVLSLIRYFKYKKA